MLNYAELKNEIIWMLENTQEITLATCFKNKVTARTMAIVNEELTIMFQTDSNSEKIQQMRGNPNIAFAIGNIQIEAMARICENPKENPFFLDKYKEKYPQYYAKYTDILDEILVIAIPVKTSLYKYIDGMPCVDILDVQANKAFRDVLVK